MRIIQNGGLLASMKDKRVENVHTKFHIILVIFKFLVELAIQGGEENKRNI